MDKEKRKEIEKFVIEFMKDHYFKIDENNQSLYFSENNNHKVNIKAMFEEILENYIEEQSPDVVIKKKEFNEIITLASDSTELTRIKLTNSSGHNFYFGVNSIGEIMKLDKSNDMWIKLIEDKNK